MFVWRRIVTKVVTEREEKKSRITPSFRPHPPGHHQYPGHPI